MSGIGDAWDKVEETEYRWWNPKRPIEILFVELASEVGEVADAIKRSQGLGSNPRSAGDVTEELADCMSHIIVMCMNLGVSQDEFAAILSRKMDTVDQRMRDKLAKRTEEAGAPSSSDRTLPSQGGHTDVAVDVAVNPTPTGELSQGATSLQSAILGKAGDPPKCEHGSNERHWFSRYPSDSYYGGWCPGPKPKVEGGG